MSNAVAILSQKQYFYNLVIIFFVCWNFEYIPYIFNVYLPKASGTGTVKNGAVLQQISVQVKADVGLQAFGKSLQDRVHVDAVGVGPGVLKVLLQPLS